MDAEWTKVSKIECLGEVDDYVYDISIDGQDPLFFANDILVHNTDSCYFSAWPIIKDGVESGDVQWNKDIAVQVYDEIAEGVNSSFPQFMEQAFHCPRKNGEIIKAGRELVADRAIFIVKKKYAVNIYDKEGKRLDVDGKSGKIKAMGLDLKRSDTPKFVQDFLFSILENLLAGHTREQIVEQVKEFKVRLRDMPAWEKGAPKSVNKLTMYANRAASSVQKMNSALFKAGTAAGDTAMPGHVRASLNWNYLRNVHNDNYSMTITDGARVAVCKLRDNALKMTSIAYPTDELRVPDWFKELPFDHEEMDRVLVDEKVANMLDVLGWDIRSATNVMSTLNDLFTFE
jgi:hypothetical protein